MADTQPGSSGDELAMNSDSDWDDGDEVIARGYPRKYEHLEKHGFRPVWTMWDGYPGEIPEDIREYLDEDGQRRSAPMIGPLRSLAWLAGLDELVEAIDHPAYTISDQIEVVPFGADVSFPVNRHYEEGRIPPRIWAKLAETTSLLGLGDRMVLCYQVPAGVSETPTALKLRDLYGSSRIQATGTVKCMKVRHDKNLPRLEKNIRRQAGQTLTSGKLWFRATSLPALESTLYFFTPERSTHNTDNEFGPGIYTTDKLEYALDYITAGTGAILVFKDPDLQTTQLWQLHHQQWDAWVARWTRLHLTIANQQFPSEALQADFIQGAISETRGRGRRGNTVPLPGEQQQLVAASYKGCQALAECLDMIIFVERR